MSRYTGPKARVSRRLGMNVWGTKGETAALEKRPYRRVNMDDLEEEAIHQSIYCNCRKTESPIHLWVN